MRASLPTCADSTPGSPVEWPAEIEAERALDCARLKLSHGVGILDALTAALAVGKGMTPATQNIRHFSVIPDLTVAQPYTR